MAEMTEDEAKTKWCPAVRLSDGGREYFDNRGLRFGGTSGKDGQEAARCLGSCCMAWRWIGSEPTPGAAHVPEMVEEALDKSVDDVGWSTRVRNALKAERISTLRDLAVLTQYEILMWPNIGKGALEEIRRELVVFGIHLDMQAAHRPSGYCGLAGKP